MKKIKKISKSNMILIIILLFLFTAISIIIGTKIKDCSSSVSYSIYGNGTCDLTLSLSTMYCDGKDYKIVNDYAECSGIIRNEPILCKKQIPFGNYIYTLYIDDKLAETKSISCPEFYIPCEPCQGNKTT